MRLLWIEWLLVIGMASLFQPVKNKGQYCLFIGFLWNVKMLDHFSL